MHQLIIWIESRVPLIKILAFKSGYVKSLTLIQLTSSSGATGATGMQRT